MSLFNQVNSLCYWFQSQTKFVCSISLNSDTDTYFVKLKNGSTDIYKYRIESFSKKSGNLVEFELSTIVKNLIHIKENHQENKKG